MIPLKGKLAVIDNSGALLVECINVLKNKSTMGLANVGDEITVVVKRARPLAMSPNASGGSLIQKVKRGDVRRAVVVRTKKSILRPDGTSVRFDDNAAVLINNKKEPVGSRLNGVVASEVRSKGWSRIASLATKII